MNPPICFDVGLTSKHFGGVAFVLGERDLLSMGHSLVLCLDFNWLLVERIMSEKIYIRGAQVKRFTVCFL